MEETGSNREIVEFLQKRGYKPECLKLVEDSRVCVESIHLLSLEDFKSMGIGLADARLLVEKYRSRYRVEELATMVANVRSKQCTKGKQKSEKVSVEYSWQHFNEKKKRFMTVSISSGGGNRRRRLDRSSSIDTVFGDVKELYFPCGKNKSKGFLSLMFVSLLSPDLSEIDDMNMTINQYIDTKALKVCKFILHTKKKKFGRDRIFLDEEEISSDSDFEHPFSSILCPERRTQYSGTARPKSPLLEKGRTRSPLHSTPTDASERSALIKQQDEEFANSLKIDKAKESARKATIETLEYLNRRQAIRKALVPPEPTLSEDCILVVVNHVSLGRMQRFFLSSGTLENVYNWIGSLSSSPELFELFIGGPSHIKLLDPSDHISKVERHIVSMRETVNSNFTIDIESGSNLQCQLPNGSHSKADTGYSQAPKLLRDQIVEKEVRCPVCGSFLPVDVIEGHASQCAEDKFPHIISLNSSSDETETDEPGLPPLSVAASRSFNNIDKCESLKEIVSACNIDKKNALKLKVRRNYSFMDFCSKFQQPWVKARENCSLSVTFHGEKGIDQGGVSREFYSEALIDITTQLCKECDGGKAPNWMLYDDLAAGLFFMAGKLMAYSICFSGPAPNFFCAWVYNYFIGGVGKVLENLPSYLDSACTSHIIFNKVYHIETREDLQKFCTSEEGLDILSEIRFRGVPSKVDMSSRQVILKSLFMKDMLQKVIPYLQELTAGLETFGLLQKIKANPELFQFVFCPNKELQWSFEKLEDGLEPKYSADKSTFKALEIDTFKALTDAFEKIYYSDKEDGSITFSELMKFITGSATVPPLGLPSNIKVEFIHTCVHSDCRCKPFVSTCELTINVATHYRTCQEMVNTLQDAARMSKGFDDV